MGELRFGSEDEVRVELSDFDVRWEEQYERLRQRILAALQGSALGVEHVGSTSIPKICAKPIIDALLAVADSADEAAYVPSLEGAGFRFHLREPEWHEHRLLKLEAPAVNLHVFSLACPEIERMLRFRDFLRADSAARSLYESAKKELARREWEKVQDYADAKSEVIESLIAAAREAGFREQNR